MNVNFAGLAVMNSGNEENTNLGNLPPLAVLSGKMTSRMRAQANRLGRAAKLCSHKLKRGEIRNFAHCVSQHAKK